MQHYTLNTGHSRSSPRSEVRDDVIPIMAPLLEPGEHPVPWFGPDIRLVVPGGADAWLGTVYEWNVPLVTIGIAATAQQANEIWPALESLYLQLTDRPPFAGIDWRAPRQPERLPWVAAVIVGPMPAHVASMIGDFERCLAWAWVEAHD